MSKHTLGVVVLALPRLELPFLVDWVAHLEKLGVTILYLYSDQTTKKTWNKKPNPKWYHPDLSHDEVWRYWKKEIEKINIDVVCLDANTDDYPDEPRYISAPVLNVQRDMYEDVTKKAECEWVLNCDIDEYLTSRNGLSLKNYLELVSTSGVYFQQYIFESRLSEDGKPREVNKIKKYDPRIVEKGKFVYQPKNNRPANPHYLENDNTMIADSEDFVICHYRGKQVAKSSAIGEPEFTATFK